MKLKLIGLLLAFSVGVAGQNHRPKNAPVSDEADAIRIAEAALIPVYGKKQIESEKPLKAELQGNVWIVNGTLHCTDQNGNQTEICAGGVAIVKISKKNGRIISMIHEK